MIFDALDSTVALNRSADVVIVGSGPAALTLARELGAHCSILILEAGGIEATATGENCLEGEVSGLNYPLTETRVRQLGGSTALWAGYCALFDPIDFDKRSWVSHSGWPFEAVELTRYYPEAARCLHVKDGCFEPDTFGVSNEYVFSQLDNERYLPGIWRFGEWKADFAGENRVFLQHSRSVDVLINGCVTNIHLAENGESVSSLTVRTLAGTTGSIHAKHFILAAGGLETPRLMLASRDRCIDGVGNFRDQVGRWFMEHPHVSVDGIEMVSNPALAKWTGATSTSEGQKFTYCLGLRGETQEQLGVLNARVHFYRTPVMDVNAAPKVGLFFEQSPNPESRLTVTDEKDIFGMPRIRLNWNITDVDRRSHRIISDHLAEDLLSKGIASRSGSICVSSEILHSNHQLGTTRMSTSSNGGVVDENCKVHGVDNLYIAGGSVFPTVSWANPTVTVLALTLRLAHHFVDKLGYRTGL